MASGQLYPPLSGTINPMHMGHDAKYDPAVGIEASDCYAPSSTSYAYNDSYVTPYPSSTAESQPWTQYARASAPDLHVSTSYGSLSVQSQHSSSMMKDPGRPRSSPSTFGPSPESITWTTTSGLGLQYTTAGGQPSPPPATSTTTFPPNVFQTYPTDDHYSTSSPPRLRQPQPRKAFTSIAPSPAAGPDSGKRKRDDDLDLQSGGSGVGGGGKRRKRATSVASQADLSEDDRFLVQLKEDENIAWKDIAARFMNEKGKNFQVAALQMRYKRLREKFRIWEDQDVQALKLAHEYWEKYKWEIISAKMLDFGVQERWPARHCARKWTELEPSSSTPAPQPATTTTATATATTATSAATTLGLTPASVSSFSSPVEGQPHYAFMSSMS